VRLSESRWPPAIALIAFIALNIALRVWLPNEGAVRVVWPLPGIEAVLLVVLVAGDPARLASRERWPPAASYGSGTTSRSPSSTG
jgi:hypothetical protein